MYLPNNMQAISINIYFISIVDAIALLENSPVQLTCRFRSAYNMTPSSYVAGLRLAHACKLLEETTLTLEALRALLFKGA